MQILALDCPKCGAPSNTAMDVEIAVCEYCGTRFPNPHCTSSAQTAPESGSAADIPAPRRDIPIEALCLSVRCYNALRRGGLMTAQQVAQQSKAQLLTLRNMNEKCIGELTQKLAELGMTLQ